ncbi:MAG: gliding motility-associated C-terminal domain-containing protein [Flavobacteriia bacterium]|nr:gliding motility-associated C-terminal domain-containing protein [Flavobacteriia bacterium]
MRKILFLFAFIFTVFYGKSQLITLLDNLPGKQTVVTCDSLFIDDGGLGHPDSTIFWYAEGVNDTITFVPDYTGKKIRFTVEQFRLEIGDVLCVYDGCEATNSNLIGCYTQNGDNTMQLNPGDVLQASSFNNSGCLTFVFISDTDGKVNAGWNFKVSCFVPCQDIIASGTFDGLAPEENIIKLCRNGVVDLSAFGVYPDMGTPQELYTQNNQLSSFTWYISGPAGSSNEVTETGTYNPLTGFSEGSHTFADSGIYHIRLEIKDTLTEFECINRNYIHNIVYVSGPPVFTNVNPVLNDTTRPIFPIICLGDTNYLIGIVDTVFHIDSCTPITSEIKKIPDGQEEDGLRTVEISGDFKCYGKEMIDEITDIESFAFDIEHSALGDLEIILSCPSGNTVVINSPSTCFANLGSDNSPPSGVVETYTFNMSSLQTLQQAGDISGLGCNSTYFIPEGSYLPEESFANFIGCPINGTWTLSIKDTKINDNGNAGNWLLTFGTTVNEISDSTFYNVYLDSNWVEEVGNPATNIHFTPLAKGDTLGLFPTEIGTYRYKFEVVDDFGCTYDTIVEFIVLERKQADFTYPGPFEFCENDPATISPVFLPGFMNIMGESGTWTSNPAGLNISSSGVITIAGSTPGIYTIQNEVITPLTGCVDIHTFTDTIIIYPNPMPNILGAGTYCATDTLTIAPTLGDAPYESYLWSNGSTNDTLFAIDAMNPITVTVTDTNSCQATSSPVTVTTLAQATSNTTITICKGASAIIHGIEQTAEGVYTQQFDTGQTSCDSVATVTLQFYPSVNLGPDVSICQGDSTTLTAGGIDIATSNFTWSNSMFGSSIVVDPIINTEYRVVATDINGCVTTDSINVLVNPIRDINLAYSQGTVCVNSPSPTPTYTDFAGYFFTSNPTGIDAGTGLLDATQLATPGTYVITFSDGVYQCNINNTATIEVTNSPNADFTYGIICVPGTTACPILTGTAGIFSLDPSSQTGIVFAPSTGCIDLTSSQAGTYTIKNTIPAAGVCPLVEHTETINIYNKPTVSGSASNNDFCVGDTTRLNGSATGNIGVMSYTWDNDRTDNIIFNPTSSMTYTVTGTDGTTQCFNTAIVSVIVNPLPVIDPMTNPSICFGECTDIQVSTPFNPNGNLISFAWDNGLGSGSLKNVCPASTTTYTVTAFNNITTCQNMAQVTVNVNQPMIDAGVDQAICIGSTASLCASGALDYTWSPAFGLDNTTTQCVNSSATNTTTYTITGTDVNGCTFSDVMTLVVNPLPIITATADPNVMCSGVPTTVNIFGATSYVVDGTNIAGSSTTVNTSNGGATPIVQNILIVGTDDNNCINSYTLPVTVNPLPVIDAGSNTVVCEGAEVTLFASGTNSITWAPALPDGAGNGEAFIATATQTYTATGTDINGCQGSDQVTVGVNPNPTVTGSSSDLTPCEGDVITLSGGGIANGTYIWSNGVVDGDPFNVSEVSNNYVVTGIDANGCMDTAVVSITVNPNPQVIAQANDYEICNGNEVIISATAGFAQYSWSPTGTNQSFTDNPVSSTTYTVVATDANGCTATASTGLVVVVPNNVTASFTPDSLQGYPGLTVDFVNNSSNATNYIWNFGNGSAEVNTDSKGNQFAEYLNEGQYYVHLNAFNSNTGCTDDTTIIITVVPFDGAIVCTPNIFTPNEDGDNDYFFVNICGGIIEKLDVVVYNRWGNQIHSFGGTFDPTKPDTYWDGTKDGKPVSEGVYFYTYEVVGKNGDVVKGHDNIHLVRDKK